MNSDTKYYSDYIEGLLSKPVYTLYVLGTVDLVLTGYGDEWEVKCRVYYPRPEIVDEESEEG